MNPPIQSTPYQTSATPMYPLKPQEVPVMPPASYADGHASSTQYPPATGYPSAPPANNPGQSVAFASAAWSVQCFDTVCLSSLQKPTPDIAISFLGEGVGTWSSLL